MRIVSLLPSATEIVAELGLLDDLVAVSEDCDYPPEAGRLPTVSASRIDSGMASREIDRAVKENEHAGKSLYHLDEKQLEELNPDLVLTQEQCEVCAPAFDEVKESCRVMAGAPTVVSLEAHSLNDILDSIEQVGRLTDREDAAAKLIDDLKNHRETILEQLPRNSEHRRVLTLEWLDPPFVGGHWIPEMIRALEAESYAEPGAKSEEVSFEAIDGYDPDISILMPCGFGLDRTRREGKGLIENLTDRGEPSLLGGAIYATDGSSYFSRPGPRVFDGFAILAKILHPRAFEPLISPEGAAERLA